jgi:glycine cleavage system aminomethyltransferase T
MAQRRVAVEAVRRNLVEMVLQGPQAVKVVMVLTGNHLVQLTLVVVAVQLMALV